MSAATISHYFSFSPFFHYSFFCWLFLGPPNILPGECFVQTPFNRVKIESSSNHLVLIRTLAYQRSLDKTRWLLSLVDNDFIHISESREVQVFRLISGTLRYRRVVYSSNSLAQIRNEDMFTLAREESHIAVRNNNCQLHIFSISL